MNVLLLICCLLLSATARQDQVCYPNVGCFSMKEPWLSPQRPVPAPEDPDIVGIRAFYFNREDKALRYNITTYPHADLNGAPFDSAKETFFITHGFENGGSDRWIMDLKDAILKRVDGNVFIGDWRKGASSVSYFQAVGNLRMAARQFVMLFQHLIRKRGLDVDNLHLMGHSLGAQTCGAIAKNIPGIKRITGFDTSQPLFEGLNTIVRLTNQDAEFVLTIHADARPFIPDLGFGYMNEVGDVAFYLNSGHGQPGCSFPKVVRIPKIQSLADYVAVPQALFMETLLCPHGMSHDYFIEALNNTDCVFWGYNASWTNMLTGISNTATSGYFSKYLGIHNQCTYRTCIPMGLDTMDWPARGAFVVTTRGFSPYCLYEAAIIPDSEQTAYINRFVKASLDFFVKNKTTPVHSKNLDDD